MCAQSAADVHVDCFSFGTTSIRSRLSSNDKSLHRHPHRFTLGDHLRGSACPRAELFGKLPNLFPKCYHLISTRAAWEGPPSQRSHSRWSVFSIVASPGEVASHRMSHFGLICVSLMLNAAGHLFLCLFATCEVSNLFPLFKVVLFIFLLLSLRVLYIFIKQAFYRIHSLQTFSPSL